ncbi:MAG: hypothetical protein KAG53_10775 [Endozoicomonadaceae bacterium]|nr:hypothetical protein [Endozoicomonadaceae bacterium]
MTINTYEQYPGERLYRMYGQLREHNERLDMMERAQETVVSSSAPVVYWAQRPVGQTEQVIRSVPSSVGPSTVVEHRVRHGSISAIPVQPVMGVHSSVNEAFRTPAEEIRSMFLANDRYCSHRLFFGDTSMTEVAVEYMLNETNHKSSQHIIDNMGPDTIRRDKNGDIISREQWVLDSSNNKFRQVVYYV